MDMDFTERLIREVKKRPILYSVAHMDYKNNKKKIKAWMDVGRELNEDVLPLKTKWKNLKDTYKKYKSSQNSKTCTQAVKKLRNWTWADEMRFTDQENTLNEPESGTESVKVEFISMSPQSGEDESSHIEHDDAPQDILNAQQINKQRKRSNPAPDPTDRMFQIQNTRDCDRDEEKVEVKCDGTDLLFLGYADALKKLSKRIQIKAKFDIARILMDAELNDLDPDL